MAWEDTNQHLIEESTHLTNVVIGLIKKRLKLIPQLQSEANKKIIELSGGKVLKCKERKLFLKQNAPKLYRLSSDLAKEVDKLNRSMGELYAGAGKEKANFLDKGLFEDLFSGKWNLNSEELTKRLAAFETKLSTYKDTIKSAITDERFTVGHHQHLSSLRDLAIEANKSANPKWWGEYTRRLNELGYDLGDLGMKRITPITHKPLQKFKTGPQKGQLNVLGYLADAGITEKTPGFRELLKTIEPITAHAEGNISAKIPARFSGLNIDDAVEASLPYLDVEKARSEQASTVTQLIKNWHKRLGGKAATTEDINKLKSVISRIEPLDLTSFEKLQSAEDAKWFGKLDEAKGSKFINPRVLGGLYAGIQFADFFRPGSASSLKIHDKYFNPNIKEEEKPTGGEIAKTYGSEMLTTGKVMAGIGLTNILTKGLVTKGASMVGMFNPYTATAIALTGIASTGDDIFFGGAGKKKIKETAEELAEPLGEIGVAEAEGAALTSIPGDFDYKPNQGTYKGMPIPQI